MRFAFFCHSLVSDWNHGNAHFLRGVVRELKALGHEAAVFEPIAGWSRSNLVADQGEAAVVRFEKAFPDLRSQLYDHEDLDLDVALAGADVAIAHEWTDPAVLARLGRHRIAGGRHLLLFHDTHHRAVSRSDEIDNLALEGFDGVLAFGDAVRELYLRRGWARRAWTWHEAADTALFRPLPGRREGDLIWIGNWGDDERTAELHEFLLRPIAKLGLTARIHGVRYPKAGLEAIGAAGAEFAGYLPNHRAPDAFARFAVTIHVPRRPYIEALPGIPTIRVFEALACGIPLVSAPWRDCEDLFRPGVDFLFAGDGDDMARKLRAVLSDADLARSLARSGLETIHRRHTCAHRVQELLAIVRKLRGCGELAAAGGG
jgi:spore maturation protein CgeB